MTFCKYETKFDVVRSQRDAQTATSGKKKTTWGKIFVEDGASAGARLGAGIGAGAGLGTGLVLVLVLPPHCLGGLQLVLCFRQQLLVHLLLVFQS